MKEPTDPSDRGGRRGLRPDTKASSSDQPAPAASRDETARPGEVPVAFRMAAAYAWRIALFVIVIYGGLRIADYFLTLVAPFLVAVLFAALLYPIVTLLDRWLPRGLSAAITVIALLAVLSGVFTLVGTQISGEMSQLTAQALAGFVQLQAWLSEGPLQLGSEEINAYVQEITNQVSANSGEIARQALTVTATAGEIITGLVLAIFTLIFLLLDGRSIWLWMVRLVPRRGRARADAAGLAGWTSLTSYVRATVLVALVDAIGIGIGAALLGVPLVVPLALLVFVGAFVPIVGALVSGAVAVLVALLTLGWVKALIMLAIVIGVQQVESHVLQPFLMGRMVSVHPLAVVFAIGAGIIVGGIVGALFAVPLVAVINTVALSLAAPSDPTTAAEPPPDEISTGDGDEIVGPVPSVRS